MSLSSEERRARFHRNGPWAVAIAAILVLIVVEADRHHALHSEEVLFFVVLIPTIILHEVSHGVVANWCGDDTAKRAGRLSLNPIRHIDPIGTVLLPILLIVTTHLAFGWAKPVPIRVDRLRHPRNQAVLVGLAGPATNIVLALPRRVRLPRRGEHPAARRAADHRLAARRRGVVPFRDRERDHRRVQPDPDPAARRLGADPRALRGNNGPACTRCTSG